ncbi:hypothetical protein TNCV_379111 [Trichonephila clavipes]|nr:hypothetical protein TNCV_379111 [Trichonephila clavipes]
MDGSKKVTPLVMGKSAKPRCFKGINSFPTKYRSNKKVWMTTELFNECSSRTRFDDCVLVDTDIAVWGALSDAEIVALDYTNNTESDEDESKELTPVNELRYIAEELKLVVPDNAKALDLRELIQESEIYKNDKETYQAIVDCVLEEINDRRNENENRLEIEKIKLSQLEQENPHNHLIHFPKPDKESVALNQTVQRSVLNPLADVFGGPEGSDCVVSPQGGNEENKSFVATSFLKN